MVEKHLRSREEGVQKAKVWADIPEVELDALISESQRYGWREALNQVKKSAPFFVKRMRNIGLGNWHLLLARQRTGKVLDIGCGFGSLIMGLA